MNFIKLVLYSISFLIGLSLIINTHILFFSTQEIELLDYLASTLSGTLLIPFVFILISRLTSLTRKQVVGFAISLLFVVVAIPKIGLEFFLYLAQAFFLLISYYVVRYWVFNPPWNHPPIFRNKVFIIVLAMIVPLMTILLTIYAFIADLHFWRFLFYTVIGWSYASYKARIGSAIDAHNRGELNEYSHLFYTDNPIENNSDK